MDAFETVSQGRLGGAILNATKKRVKEQEEEILKRLISQYRGNTLTAEILHGCIGEISALRQFTDRLEMVQKRGQAMERKEHSDG